MRVLLRLAAAMVGELRERRKISDTDEILGPHRVSGE
jgi:hypothetical protein